METLKWQTRSDVNGIQPHKTKEEAFQEAENDPTVWKVSGPGHRYIRQEDNSWKDEPVERIIEETVKKYKEIMADPIKRAKYYKECVLWNETVGDGLDN